MPEWTEPENTFAKSFQKALGSEEKGYHLKVSSLNQPVGIQTGGASTDVGEVSLVAPTATLNFPGLIPGVIGHHWSTVASGYGKASWKGLNTGAKVISATALDLLTKPKLLEAIRTEFAEYSNDHPYKSFLPEGARPPVLLPKEKITVF